MTSTNDTGGANFPLINNLELGQVFHSILCGAVHMPSLKFAFFEILSKLFSFLYKI